MARFKKLKAVGKWLISPYVKIRLKNVIGTDDISRKQTWCVGVLWEIHKPGYYEIWYDGPICHISLGLVSIYWHDTYERIKEGEKNEH